MGRLVAAWIVFVVCAAAPAAADEVESDGGRRFFQAGIPVELRADSLEYEAGRDLYVASGNVRIRQTDRVLRADWMAFSDATRQGVASGDVVYTDGTDTVYQTWTILVTVRDEEPDNQPPYFLGRPVRNAVGGVLYEYDVEAEYPDGNALAYHLNGGPDGATIDTRTGLIQWLPPIIEEGEKKAYVFSIDVTDGVNVVPLEFTVKLKNPPDQPPSIKGKLPDVSTSKEYTLDLTKYMDAAAVSAQFSNVLIDRF